MEFFPLNQNPLLVSAVSSDPFCLLRSGPLGRVIQDFQKKREVLTSSWTEKAERAGYEKVQNI